MSSVRLCSRSLFFGEFFFSPYNEKFLMRLFLYQNTPRFCKISRRSSKHTLFANLPTTTSSPTLEWPKNMCTAGCSLTRRGQTLWVWRPSKQGLFVGPAPQSRRHSWRIVCAVFFSVWSRFWSPVLFLLFRSRVNIIEVLLVEVMARVKNSCSSSLAVSPTTITSSSTSLLSTTSVLCHHHRNQHYSLGKSRRHQTVDKIL